MAERKKENKNSKNHEKRFDRKCTGQNCFKNEDGYKTPPLPTSRKRTVAVVKTINDLKNGKHPEDSICKNKTHKNPYKLSSRSDKNDKYRLKNQETFDVSEQSDSEDEERIIEQRRKQRKQLIEKLSTTIMNDSSDGIMKKEIVKRLNQNKTEIRNISKEPREIVDSKKSADMFAEKDEFDMQLSVPYDAAEEKDPNNTHLKDNWDDPEGYYIIKSGDLLNNNRYAIKNTMGQGVFATVVKATDKSIGNRDVAIKIARNNDLIYNTALKEITTLKTINNADPQDQNHCVQLLRYFTHRGHMCLVLESFSTDLRSILKKRSKNIGLNIRTTACYSKQLLLALKHLYKCGIIHADIKPDNIIINNENNLLKLCDFGSAERVNDNVEVKPYLVSRFYRAPEIILGIPYSYSIDLWSTACTVYEVATGRILFTGGSNNKMIKCFIDVKGKIPNKLINMGKFKNEHFNYKNNFLLHKKDEMTGRDKVVEIIQNNPTRNLMSELKQYGTAANPKEEKMLSQLKDFLEKTLMIDPNHRPTLNACLKHPFVQDCNIRDVPIITN